MNANRRVKMKELIVKGSTPKQAYEATKEPKIVGYRKPKTVSK